ncbi:MAG: flagellar biosynthesis protein FlhF [Epsilonproteobacteria bacterium]|nr:flagellar biosynthesis protein FlhF [Campylobacterota bacterium]
MKVVTFTGSTPSEALKKVKMEYGDEAMIIETKTVRKKTLHEEGLYEILVGIDEELEKQSSLRKQQNTIQEPLLQKESEDILFDISNAAKQISKVAKVTKDPFADLYKTSTQQAAKSQSSDPKELKEIKTEITKLADKVKLIQNMFWEEKSPELNHPIPPEFAEIYKLASQSGMDREHLDSIMKLTLEHMPTRLMENSQTVKRYFQTLLRKMIPIRLESLPTKGATKVMMFVGPTGVGKTTTIAKLAARYSFLMEKKYKVGLIVLDTYRIGAVEQLMQYARMMKLGIETVVDPPEFTTALNALSYCDFILIDTMGSSPYDRKKIETIYECLEASNGNYNIDVSLVLPSSLKYEDLLIAHENFSTLNIDTIIFTKLDETRGFGNIFSFALETKMPISYFSVGQEVPEDLVVASSDFLVECLLHGFDRSKA